MSKDGSKGASGEGGKRKRAIQVEASTTKDSQLKRPDLVQFELNLEDAPLFASQARHLSRGAFEYVEQYTTEDGKKGEKKWRFKPPDDYGELDIFDQDVYMAINALVQERGGMPADGKISFTIYELVRILDLPENGQSYARVRESILRMGKTLIDAENAFYRKDKLSYESEHFIIWRVHFEANADLYGRASERHTLRFDEVLVRSHRSGYIRQLDVNYYLSLSGTHAKSLYRLIDHRRAGSLEWTVGVKRLKDLLGMAPSYRYPSKIKEKLQPAHEELISKGFLKEVRYPEKNTVTYQVADSFVSARSQLERAWSTQENRAIRNLIRNQVWPNVAKKLVLECGVDKCAFYVRSLPYQKGIRDPGAWLKWAIEEAVDVFVPEDQQPMLVDSVEPRTKDETSSVSADRNPRADTASGTRDDDPPDPPEEPPASDPVGERIWNQILDAMEEQLDTPSFKVWFEGTVPTHLEGETLTIVVPNAVAQEYISTKFKTRLEQALIFHLGENATLQVLVRGQSESTPVSGQR